jgi:uncharacterized membrane protein YgdD (TMEM256/DUF423 family)
MNWSALASLLLALAVMIGAFGAHGLRDRLDAYSLGVYEKAVFYHFIHALGMLATGILQRVQALSARDANVTGMLLGAGILLFSGSLYALALSGVKTLGIVTPFGGLAFIAAWAWLAFALYRHPR